MERTWVVVAYVAQFVLVGAFAPYLVVYYEAIGLDLRSVGLLMSAAALTSLLLSPVWGWLSDRADGAPSVFLAACATAAAGTFLLGLAATGAPALPGATVFAAGLAGVSPILDARALERSGRDRSGWGPLRAWGSASFIVSSLLTGVAIQVAGMGALFLVLFGAIVATAVAGARLRPDPAARDEPGPAHAVGALFRRGGIAPFLLAALVAWVGLGAVSTFIPLRFGELGAGASVLGVASALGALVEVPVMVRFPALAARVGSERLLTIGAAFLVIRALLAAVAREPLMLVGAAAVGGLGFALFLVGATTHVSRRAPPDLAATAQGAFQGVSVGLGQVLAAAAGGAVGAAVGLPNLFLACAIVGALAAVLIAITARAPSLDRP